MTPMAGLFPHFLAPARLWLLLLIPLLVAAYIFASRRKNRSGMRFTNTSVLAAVVPKQSQWRRHLAVALSLLSLITLTCAFAKPTDQVDVPRERATIVVLLDVSLSMQATDVKPDRITVAKQAAKEFVDSLPDKYNVSLVAVSGSPTMILPPTLDHAAVQRGIQNLQLRESTALGESIVTGLRALDQAPKDKNKPNEVAPGAMVLLSDGGNTAGRPGAQAAAEAAQAKTKIYTIAYGTENGYVDLDGQRQLAAVDKAEMKQIAEISHGEEFDAASAEQLKKVYQEVGTSVGYEKADREVTARWAGYGFGFAVLAALCAISLGARWP